MVQTYVGQVLITLAGETHEAFTSGGVDTLKRVTTL